MSDDTIAKAEKMGRDAGKAAASWVFDGNTPQETYARVLKGIEDGDPEVMDAYREPNLSGEFADDPTEVTVCADLGIEPYTDEASEACDAWAEAASAAFWDEIERMARYQLGQ